jgi:hypothetical protein
MDAPWQRQEREMSVDQWLSDFEEALASGDAAAASDLFLPDSYMWKPTRQEALWSHGGNLHQSRHYSLYLALQLKARLEGLARRYTDCRRCTILGDRCPLVGGPFV